jgi:hypothetical protein
MYSTWEISYFEIFYEQYTRLISDVYIIKSKNPENYKNHKKTKLLAKIISVIDNQIQVDPMDKKFHLGSTLPKEYRAYKRAKSGLPSRHRLFFRYKSDEDKLKDGEIVIIWMNSELTLRKSGDKNDVYNVFLKMLQSDTIPANWKALIKKSKLPSELKKKIS